ncbi:Hsp20/alpha crystallin family protein [Oceanobacillus halotolerans]|uniref:Hsp20/alpha crystallin family protein n=1 Tax=Oceanobacillus halotolerans TaxID=2663380 RepID=UPI0013DD622A|nr:Hsp20/alpha crystallin family protein [Oceanobacillus halotolerans]
MSTNKNLPEGFDHTSFHQLMKQMDQFLNESVKQFNDFFQQKPFEVNMYETNKDIVVEANLPGYKPNQIELEAIGNQLRIAVEDNATLEEKNDEKKFLNKEQSFFRSERVVTLPYPIPEQDTKASFYEGILKISIPKKDRNINYIDIDES